MKYFIIFFMFFAISLGKFIGFSNFLCIEEEACLYPFIIDNITSPGAETCVS